MRKITLWLVIAVTTFLFGIYAVTLWFAPASRHSGQLANVQQQKEQDSVVQQQSARGSVLVEASLYYGGMYCYEGNLLELRVYTSGDLEYDILRQETPCWLGSQTKPTRRSAKLTPDELKELLSLSKQPDLLTAKKDYSALVHGTDTYWDETITLVHQGKEKKIVLHNPDVNDSRAKSVYPASLIILLQRVGQIRNRLGERS